MQSIRDIENRQSMTMHTAQCRPALSKDAALTVRDLNVTFRNSTGDVSAVKSVNIDVGVSEIVGIVGESGSGKSATAMAVSRLLPARHTETSGKILIGGRDIADMPERRFRRLRGRDVAVIFQDPNASLNPVVRVGNQIEEVVRLRRQCNTREAKTLILELFAKFGVKDGERVYQAYPYELSGGLRQRIAIALAFGSDPKLLIADEPTTALDVIVQKKILDLFERSTQNSQAGILFISHDLRVISKLCDYIYVMLKGEIVEEGPTRKVLGAPYHPYTRALLDSLTERHAPRSRLPQHALNLQDVNVDADT